MKKIIIILVVVIGILVVFALTKRSEAPTEGEQNSEVPEMTGEVYYTPESAEDLIEISSPRPGERIESPLVIEGEARGGWFFEATAPVVLTDWDGRIIAEGYVEAEGEWMTEDFVPFQGELSFQNPSWEDEFSKRGTLILQRANASGLPEHDAAAEIPLFFE